MKATPRRMILASAIFFSAFAIVNPLPAQDAPEEYSHARIVRLSFVEGKVTLLRPASVDWAAAAVNTPIEQGFQLSTDKNSFAEVEFENGSTARVGELSLVKFDQLALTDSGDELNRLTLDQGYGTFEVRPQSVSSFEVRSGDATFNPERKAEFRVDMDRGRVRLEVFKGAVEVASSEGNTTVAKNETLEIASGTEEAFNMGSGIERDDWDDWVAERDQQESTAAAAPPGGLPADAPAYGWSDLNQYGTWSYFNGYGYGWVPDSWGAWSPFSLGQWSWYPGFGYTWIGYEPWGWLPYHWGGWMYDAMFGWAWFPGATWAFSPGIVNWYSGPGWIGWAPQTPGRRPGGSGLGGGLLPKPPQGCPNGCLNAVNVTTFQRGGPIQPRQLMNVNPGQAVALKSPGIAPSLLAELPGSPARMSSAQRSLIEGHPAATRAAPALDRLTGIFQHGGEWAHRAPTTTFASPPASVRSTTGAAWGLGSRSGGFAGGAPIRGGAGYGSFSRGGASPAGGASRGGGITAGGSRGGFSAGGSHGGGLSGGGSSIGGGGGGHASGGGGGGGGGHH
ncbi:MAG TPA: FecR family protein [Terriglobia bacterium]|nr:FecR family protein [Terriglobia bacterium]